ncbi:hypothetical protein C0992_000940 [Termitomyces sp. T32_za158]|nr:hypothetical protein C0992_000940 [Termitomyces sp. T32_za158]
MQRSDATINLGHLKEPAICDCPSISSRFVQKYLRSMAFGYEDIVSELPSLSAWSPQKESILLEPYAYILSVKGKEIRSKLIEAFNLWLDVPEPKLTIINRLVNMFHNASLLQVTPCYLRRGQPVAHKMFGIPQTINTANYVFFLAYKELFALRTEAECDGRGQYLDAIVTEELLSLHRGQGLELYWRDSLQCPTEEEYISMVNNSKSTSF